MRTSNKVKSLYRIQNGLCYWCKEHMFSKIGPLQPHQKPCHPKMVTLDHLYQQGTPNRKTKSDFSNTVAACHMCNQSRANGEQTDFLMSGRRARGQIFKTIWIQSKSFEKQYCDEI